MKLGGSVLTDKSRYRTPRPDVLARLAGELARAPGPLVVVHGAGSYGHVLARRHRLSEGDDGSAERRLAAGAVNADVRELGALVTRALCDAGRPALWHATMDLARLRDGRLLSLSHEPLARTLARGFAPVLSGDLVEDDARGFGILSGDVLMAELARALRPARAVFVTDVDGIHDRDPRGEGATLLRRVPADARVGGGAAAGDDVTGGMAGKLERARQVARAGVPVHVVNGLVPGRLQETLEGKDVLGTVVE